MSRKKWLPLALLGGAALLLALALLALGRMDGEEGESTIPLCPLGDGTVQTIAYQQGETDVTLQRGADGTWALADDPALPLDQTTVQAMLQSICALQATRDLGADVDAGEDFGFADPYAAIRLQSGEEDFAVTVGALNSVIDGYYARVEGREDVYVVYSGDISGLCRSRRGLYAAQSLTDLTLDDLTEMTVQSGTEDLHFLHGEDGWTLADDPAYALDQTYIDRMANTVCGLQTTWTVTAPQADDAYGLDAPNATVTVRGSDGRSLTCRFGDTIPGTDETDTGSCYLKADSFPGVVLETEAEHLQAFAYTKAALAADTAAADSTP